jgi:hypothetical protein
MTDYAYPIPVHAAIQFVTDFIPNPFVSTTSDIMRALLYASGYFSDFADKFNVDWDDVEPRIEAGTGWVLLVQIPTESRGRRKIVPISKIAQYLPPPYRSIGVVEEEYGIPGSIKPYEISQWVLLLSHFPNSKNLACGLNSVGSQAPSQLAEFVKLFFSWTYIS